MTLKATTTILAGIALTAALGMATPAHAVDGPSTRDWIPAPPGAAALITYWTHDSSRRFDAGGQSIPGLDLSIDGPIFRPLYFFEAGGIIHQPEIILPYLKISLKGEGFRETVKGFADPMFGWTFWFVHNDDAGLWIGYEPFITAPIGHYDTNKPDVSPGENRWSTTHDLAIVKSVGESSFIEANFEVTAFGKNKNYYKQAMRQKPIYDFYLMASTDITPTTYIGARYLHEWGGRVTLDGERADPSGKLDQIALELTSWLGETNQLQLMYAHDFKVRDGVAFKGLRFRWLHIF